MGNNRVADTSKMLDVAKVIATILVVVGHITRYNCPDCRFPQMVTSEFLRTLTDFIYSFHMPAFFAISGAVYFIVKRVYGRYNDKRKFVRTKVSRLLIPYLFFCVMGFTLFLHIFGFINYQGSLVGDLARRIFGIGDLGWFWFLYALFIIVVFFNYIHESFLKHKLLYVSLFFCVSTVGVLFKGFWSLPSQIMIHAFYFVLGYCVCEYFIDTKSLNVMGKKKYMFCLLMIFTCCFYIFRIVLIEIPYLPLITNQILAILGTLSLFSISAWLLRFDLDKYRIYRLLSRNSFGVYLFHSFVIIIIYSLTVDMIVSPYLMGVVSTIISILFSLLMTWMFKLSDTSRRLIGEKPMVKTAVNHTTI